MIPHDILTLYAAKPVEYLIAVAFLLLFVPFWRYVQGGQAVRERAVARAPRLVPRLVEWFALPERLSYHPGHAWVRVERDDLATVGMDDFAHKLVGPLVGVRLPAPGTRVALGEPAWTLLADNRGVEMLSPVDGVVLETNPGAVTPGRPTDDPYGRGWLLRVQPTRLGANLRTLLNGEVARRWTAAAADALRGRLSPELGLVYQDGGVPVHGVARSLDPEHWDRIAREFFLTDGDH